LAVFVISAEANTKDQIDDKMIISDGGYKVWLKEVNRYDKNDPINGYAGIFGEPVTNIRISDGYVYRAHLLGQNMWLPKVSGNDKNDFSNGYSGTVNGNPIDAIVIGGGVEYAVHILGEDWLPPVTGYNLNDSKNGYAGIFGKPIDAIMVQNRIYAVSYTDNNINGSTQKNDDCNCNCTTEANAEDNSSSGYTFNSFSILATVLSIAMIMTIF